MGKRSEIHNRVLNASNKEELESAYSDWADTYDHDLIEKMGYAAPLIASRLLTSYADNSTARILDAGCGTGLVGECLHRQGYNNIEGFDYSRAMLKKAAQKQIYRELTQGDLKGPLEISSDTYDAVISVGTFTCGHVGPDAFDELVRITRPGGYICFTVREQAWETDNYRDKIKDLQHDGAWNLLEENTADYIQSEGSNCRVCLYRVAR